MTDQAPESTCVLHTDGSALGNGRRDAAGGWAFVMELPSGEVREAAGSEAGTTNNRMELLAAIRGLEAALEALGEDARVELRSDSEHVVLNLNERIAKWKAAGWRNASRKTPENLDLVKALDDARASLRVQAVWVKGHAGDPMNERCDHLARQAAGQI